MNRRDFLKRAGVIVAVGGLPTGTRFHAGNLAAGESIQKLYHRVEGGKGCYYWRITRGPHHAIITDLADLEDARRSLEDLC